MNAGKLVFAQLMDFIPRCDFDKCVRRYQGNYRARGFLCRDQYLGMAFAQLTYRESLRDIETCLRSVQPKLYHWGFRGRIARSTIADANRNRDWRIYADFAQVLIAHAQKLYADEPFGIDLKGTVYALDSTVIDLCLSLFPWARFRRRKGAVKMHTLLDLRGNIPCFIRVLTGKMHDVNILDELPVEPGASLRHGQGIRRLHAFVSAASTIRILCYTCQKEPRLQTPKISRRRQNDRTSLRSDDRFARSENVAILSRTVASNSLLRCRQRQTICVFDKQLRVAGTGHRAALQVPLANRTVFQIDQTTSANQSLLWYVTQRCANSSMDRNQRLRACGDCKERTEHKTKPPQNPPNFECQPLRKNPYFSASNQHKLQFSRHPFT